jgi:hypothetical protein
MASDLDLEATHKHCGNHRAAVMASDLCGCFFCRATFRPGEIVDWVDKDSDGIGKTALCPRCGIDAVVASASGVSLAPDFLARMREFWFDR